MFINWTATSICKSNIFKLYMAFYIRRLHILHGIIFFFFKFQNLSYALCRNKGFLHLILDIDETEQRSCKISKQRIEGNQGTKTHCSANNCRTADPVNKDSAYATYEPAYKALRNSVTVESPAGCNSRHLFLFIFNVYKLFCI